MSWRNRIRTFIGSANQLRRRINNFSDDSPFLIGLFTGAVAWIFFMILHIGTSVLGYEWTWNLAVGSVFLTSLIGSFVHFFPKWARDPGLRGFLLYGFAHGVIAATGASIPLWSEALRDGLIQVGPYLLSGVIISLVISYVLRRWGEEIEDRLIEASDKAKPWVMRAQRPYQWLRRTYSSTALWLLIHLIPLGLITMAGALNRFFGLNIPVGNLFIIAAGVMALESAIYMYLMREWMKRSLLFGAAAYIIIFKPWEDPALLSFIGLVYLIAILIILAWHPEEILEGIIKKLDPRLKEWEILDKKEFDIKFNTTRGFLLSVIVILLSVIYFLVKLGRWGTNLFQDWHLQVNMKQLLLLPINLIAVVGIAVFLQYPVYQPLDEFTPKAVRLSEILMFFWVALWLIRWIVQAWQRFSSIIRHAQKTGFSSNVLGNLVTVWVIISLGLATTSYGLRQVPSIVGEGTAWLYADALPIMERVGEIAARLIGMFI